MSDMARGRKTTIRLANDVDAHSRAVERLVFRASREELIQWRRNAESIVAAGETIVDAIDREIDYRDRQERP